VRVRHQPGLPSFSNTPRHLYLSLGDHLGSTSVIIDMESSEVTEKATYMAYGAIESDHRPERWGGTQREEYKFTGKEEDTEVGLTYFGARYYHARLGRFISADPLAVHTTRGDPNPYAYVRGRVFAATDPFGLDGKSTLQLPAPTSGPMIIANHVYNHGWAHTKADVVDAVAVAARAVRASASTLSAFNMRQTQVTVGMVKAAVEASRPWRSTDEVVAKSRENHTPMTGSAAAFAQGLGHGYMSKCASSTPIPIGARVASEVDARIGKPPAGDVAGSIGEDIGSVLPEAIIAVATAGASAIEEAGVKAAADGVTAYEVGSYDALQAKSIVGDGLDLHHVGQAHIMEQLVPGYSRAAAPAIALPQLEHRAIPTLRGAANLSARDLLARDIMNLRRYTNAPNSSLRQLIELNKTSFPEAFAR
jgi:RHS repeat-associated protein